MGRQVSQIDFAAEVEAGLEPESTRAVQVRQWWYFLQAAELLLGQCLAL